MTQSHQQKLEAIREKCIEANPRAGEIRKEMNNFLKCINYQKSSFNADAIRFMNEDLMGLTDTTLADVLIAIGKITGYEGKCWMISPSGEFFCAVAPFKQTEWNLHKPLESQDEPTISFIHSLLCE